MALRNQEIGARLRQLRGQRPQTVVADELGVAERTYQNWEAGDAKPSYRNLQRIAEYFGVGEDYILTGDGDRAGAPEGTPSPIPPATDADRLAALETRLARMEDLLVGGVDRLDKLEAMMLDGLDKLERALSQSAAVYAGEIVAGIVDAVESGKLPTEPAQSSRTRAAKTAPKRTRAA